MGYQTARRGEHLSWGYVIQKLRSNTAWAGFGQLDFHATDALTLTAGGRYSYEKKRFTNQPLFYTVAMTYNDNWDNFSPKLGVKPPKFETMDIHVHVPDGATPKDGPSAGLAMVTAIVSVLTGIPVRKDIAMTGEVTLRGNASAIGGLKEKLLAALRGGIKTVFIPEENAKDLAEIPENVKEGLKIIPVTHVREVLARALVRMPEPVEWDEAAEEAAAAAAAKAKAEAAGATAH